MYDKTIPILFSNVTESDWESFRGFLHSNGTYVRDHTGRLLGKVTPESEGIYVIGRYKGELLKTSITDEALVQRIRCYWDRYVGQYITNCASFAHFLTSGIFVECEEEKYYHVVEQGMRICSKATKINIGDMVCILYVNNKAAESRRNPSASLFRGMRRRHRGRDEFPLSLRRRAKSFTPEELRKIFLEYWVDNLHFMVCVAKHEGQPVWLSQAGYNLPGERPPMFSVTWGMRDPYPEKIPALTFVKKRRTK